MAGRALKKITENYPDIDIQTIEVTTNPWRAWKDGIRMIPALRIGDKTLAGILLSPGKISAFIDKNRAES